MTNAIDFRAVLSVTIFSTFTLFASLLAWTLN